MDIILFIISPARFFLESESTILESVRDPGVTDYLLETSCEVSALLLDTDREDAGCLGLIRAVSARRGAR